MEQYIFYAKIYLCISFFFLILNCVIAGYKGEIWNWYDIKDSLFWPLGVAILIGVLIRLIKETINTKNE